MLKRKRIAGSITSAAVTTAILLGAVMPGVVLADEVTIFSEKSLVRILKVIFFHQDGVTHLTQVSTILIGHGISVIMLQSNIYIQVLKFVMAISLLILIFLKMMIVSLV